jgi:tRNA G18 (ribose-2'-O)-methylase SpoU
MNNVYVALENIRSLYNIGAIFRTCSFFGVTKVLLVGYSGRNFDTRGNVVLHEEIKKSSLGSEKDIEINFVENSNELILYAKKNDLQIVSIEQNEKSTKLCNWKPTDNTILVFGNEVDGVSKEILEASNEIVEIERVGKHNSLNVTTACGIILSFTQREH